MGLPYQFLWFGILIELAFDQNTKPYDNFGVEILKLKYQTQTVSTAQTLPRESDANGIRASLAIAGSHAPTGARKAAH